MSRVYKEIKFSCKGGSQILMDTQARTQGGVGGVI